MQKNLHAHRMSCFLRRALAGGVLLFGAALAGAQTLYFDFGPDTRQTTPNYNNVTRPNVHTLSGLIDATGADMTRSY